MSLLQNEDYVLATLRTSYLQHIHDGVGDRLITINPSSLNNPAFRASGFPSTADIIKRTYSPPIPTAIGVSSEYFQAPVRTRGRGRSLEDGGGEGWGGNGEEEDDDDGGGGLITGRRESGDMAGAVEGLSMARRTGRRGKRGKDQLQQQEEEDDSSELSDESDEDEGMVGPGQGGAGNGGQGNAGNGLRPAASIRFAKMPVRRRAGSSPLRSTQPNTRARGESDTSAKTEGDVQVHGSGSVRPGGMPDVMITSPSRRDDVGALRRGSLGGSLSGGLETVNERPRRDTVTSSEMSSENELDPSVFRRKSIQPHRPTAGGRGSHILSQRIREDEGENEMEGLEEEDQEGADSDVGDDADSTLSSEFVGTVDSASFLQGMPGPSNEILNSSPPPITRITSASGVPSPKKGKKNEPPTVLQALPPPRPISMAAPVSALTQALKAKNKQPENPVQRFAVLSGKGEANPLWIKIFVPSSSKSSKPIEMPIKRNNEEGTNATVSEAIGLALYKYKEDALEPELSMEKLNLNKWVLRMYEDGEVEDEFPPLTRTKAVIDFASNNTRPARGRARDKPWDEFALVEASLSELEENEKQTPLYSTEAEAALETSNTGEHPPQQQPVEAVEDMNIQSTPVPPPPQQSTMDGAKRFQNPIIAGGFGPSNNAAAAAGGMLADAPAAPVSQAQARIGAPRQLQIHFTNPDDFSTRHIRLDATTDTYLAEVFERACSMLNIDKALYIFRVSGTTSTAPLDRTVEALGRHTSLDLGRRRFVTDGAFGLSASPAGESPNAPLLISTTSGTPQKKLKQTNKTITGGGGGGSGALHGIAAGAAFAGTAGSYAAGLLGSGGNPSFYKRYLVVRKQPMSFTSSSSRILALDGEYMHLLPVDHNHNHSSHNNAQNHHNNTTGGGAENNSTQQQSSTNATDAPGGAGNTINNAIPTSGGKITTIHFSSVVGCKVSRRHPRMFRVVVFKERETKRYDFEAAKGKEEARECVSEIKRGVERVMGEGLWHY